MNNQEPKNIFSIAWLLMHGLSAHCRDKSMRINERITSFQLQLSIIIFFIGLAWVIYSATSHGLSAYINDPFQRSGSVLVLVAIYLDYSYRESAIIKISLSISSPNIRNKYYLLSHYLILFASAVRPTAIFSAVLGTLIWGYVGALQNN